MREIKFRAWDKKENETRRSGKGTYKQSGYILQYAPYHPYANKRGYVPEHRLLIENKLGRYLIPRKEIVHHLDGNRSNNDIINLKLSNPKDHVLGHIGERNSNGTFACLSPEFLKEKYRLYDRDRNITQIYTLNELISKTFRRAKFEYRGKFTGLKDKNGKEIYEGDIVTYKGHEVKNGKQIRPLRYVNIGKDWMYDIFRMRNIMSVENTFEIIGNIHENPDLIKGE